MRHSWLLMILAAACHQDTKVDVGPVSEADAKALSATLLATVTPTCDPDKLEAIVDEEALAAYVLQHSHADGPARTFAAKSMEERHTGAVVLCSWFAMDANTKFSLLHLKDGAPIIRKLAKVGKTTAVTYFKLVLGTTKHDQVVRIDDVYSFTEGTLISEGLGATVDAGMKEGISSAIDIGSAMKQIQQLRADKKPEQAMAVIDGLPETMRNLRSLRLIRVFIGREISNERYSKEMKDVLAYYPDDPSLALIAIDEAALRGDYPAALEAIDTLDHAVGGDPFQDAVRSSLYFKQGDFAAARSHAEAAVKGEPTLVRAQFSLLDAEAALGDNKAVLSTLRDLAQLHQTLSAAAIAKLPHYVAFATSPEWKTWADEHP